MPYDFSVDYELSRRKVESMSPLPFAAYLRGSYLNSLNDLLTKLSLAIPLGLAVSLVIRSRKALFSPATTIWLIAAGCLFALIEVGQFFIPSRTPDPTDVGPALLGRLLACRSGAGSAQEQTRPARREEPRGVALRRSAVVKSGVMLYYLATTLYVLACLMLLLVVLLQQGKGGDMASAFGGGGSQTAFGARAGASVLTRATTVLGVIFMIGALFLAIMGNRGTGSLLSGERSAPVAPAQAPAPPPQNPK